MNQVLETETFTKLFYCLDRTEQLWIDKIKDQLVQNIKAGKPLRYDWLREKKFGVKRLYYLISAEKALLVAYGPKKEQQTIINHVIVNKERYLKLLTSNEPV